MSHSIKTHADLECPNCKNSVEFYWDPKYNGLRGKCTTCLTNWPES